MKKALYIILAILSLSIVGCLTFGFGMPPADAATQLVENLRIQQEKMMDGSSIIPKDINYMIAVFDVVAAEGKELDEEKRKEFQQLVYMESKKLYDYRNYFSPEEIEAKEKELGSEIENESYEIKQRKIAKSLGADYIILGKMNQSMLNNLWDLQVELIDINGNVIATVEDVTYNLK